MRKNALKSMDLFTQTHTLYLPCIKRKKKYANFEYDREQDTLRYMQHKNNTQSS